MATFNKFQAFVENLAEKVHNLGADTLKLYLTNNAPSASADAVKTDLVGATEQNGYTEKTLSVSASAQSAGTYTLTVTDPTAWTASGGSFGPFQYVVLYNDTPTSPADPLIGWWDYGSAITVNTGESFDVGLTTTLTIA